MFFTPERLIEEVMDKAAVQGTKWNIDIICKVTMEAWANATPEIREEVMEEWEKRIKQLVALRAHHFKDIVLTEEERIQVIKGLGVQLKKQFKLETSLSKFGFIIVAAGYHPGKKRMESYSWEFGTEDSMGKTFIESFDKAAKSGVVPGGQKGDRQDMKTYYSPPLLAYMLEFEALNERQQSELLDATSSSDEACDGSEDDDDNVNDVVAGNVLPLHGTSTAATNEGSVVAGTNVPPANDFDDGPIPDSLGVSFWRALIPASPYFPNPQERSSDSYELLQFNSENWLPAYHENNGNLNWLKVFSQWDLSGSNFFSPSLNYASGARSPLAFLNPFPVAPPFVPPTIMPSINEMEMMEVERMLVPLAMTTRQERTPPDRPMVLSSRASSERASLSSSIVDKRAAIPLTLQLSNEQASATPHHVPNERAATPHSNEWAATPNERALAILHHVLNERAATPLPINSNKWAATPNERAPAPDIPCQPRNRKPTGSREDPTFGDDWVKLLVKWERLEKMLSKAKLTGKFLASKRLPKALLLWADSPHSFTNPFVITDIGQFSDGILARTITVDMEVSTHPVSGAGHLWGKRSSRTTATKAHNDQHGLRPNNSNGIVRVGLIYGGQGLFRLLATIDNLNTKVHEKSKHYYERTKHGRRQAQPSPLSNNVPPPPPVPLTDSFPKLSAEVKALQDEFNSFIWGMSMHKYVERLLKAYFKSNSPRQGQIGVFADPLQDLYNLQGTYMKIQDRSLEAKGPSTRHNSLVQAGRPINKVIEWVEDFWRYASDSPGSLQRTYNTRQLA
ncbi:hypothetical protein EDD18DRAFT_1110946 [Armillaria luteobubalina]|uniref:Uncharacterized protein n=1 Tax=Armillaria luteobubalina TaxID=153913 RepID=A0AA39UF31_9AGAR|nr:hypothetical protein EDD18DRAFT_1110946 [Armillaria luteobubalina]